MAKDIGPDMLARLDERLAAGQITSHEHEARRAEVLELIRKGKAVETTRSERLIQALVIIVGIVGGLILGGWVGAESGSGVLGFIIIAVAVTATILITRALGRPRR